MNARDYRSSNSTGEKIHLLWKRLNVDPSFKPRTMFQSTIKNRMLIIRNGFDAPIYDCHASLGSAQIFLRDSYSFHDCYIVNATVDDLSMKCDDCNPVINPRIHNFTANSSLEPFTYNVFKVDTNMTEHASDGFCKPKDKNNKKYIRKHVETWLRIVSDKDILNTLITSHYDGLYPFQFSQAPHIDIHIGYLANRKSINAMKYQIFKSEKLLHEGVMTNGKIYANVSVEKISDWTGTLKILIGSINTRMLTYRSAAGEKMNHKKFEIQTQLHKSKVHGMLRVWGTFPADPNDDCPGRILGELGLVCIYSNGVPSGKCWRGLLGGAWIYGEMTEDGEFSGDDIAYINQDISVGYKGMFDRALMINTSVVNVIGEHCNKDGLKVLKFSDSTSYAGIKFRYKRPNSDSMGDQPFVIDPLDNKYIDIKQSTIDTGEESQEFEENGAFGKENIPPQTVISHNNGYIVNVHERQEWFKDQIKVLKNAEQCASSSIDFDRKFEEEFKESCKKYAANLGCNEYLEIPARVGQRKSEYRSTWGHKINHCFVRQNSELVLYDSAQFGVVMAISTLNRISIPKGQEIFVDYRYTYSTGPKWYKDAFKRTLREKSVGDNTHWQKIRNIVFSEENITTIADASSIVLDKLLELHYHFSDFRT